MFTEQPQLLTQVIEVAPQPVDLERTRRIRGVLTQMSLRDEKVLFEGTRDRCHASIAIALDWAPAPVDLEAGPSSRVH